MAILPPIQDIFGIARIVDQRFQLVSRQEFSRTASGVTLGKDMGPALWQASFTTHPMYFEDALGVEARLNSLDGVMSGFYAGDIRRRMPKAHSDGSFADTGTIGSVNSNNRMLTINGLPAGFVISAGDYMEYDYGNGGSLRALLQVVNNVTASAGGIATDVEFRPHIPVGTLSGAAVRFKNPKALFTLNTEGVTQSIVDGCFTQLSFSATQSFLR